MASPLLRTFGFYRTQIPLVITVVGLAAVANGTMALSQHLFGQGVDAVRDGTAVVRTAAGGVDASGIWFWAGVIFAVAGARAVLGYLQQVLGFVLGQRLLFVIRERVFAQVQGLDQAYHRAHGAGELITRTTRDSDKVRDAVVIGARQLADLVLVFCGVFILLFSYHLLIGLVPLLLVLVASWILYRQTDTLVSLNRAAATAYDSVTQDLTEGVIGVRVVKAFGLEQRRLGSFLLLLRGFMDRSGAAIRFTATRLPLPQFVVSLGHAWIAICGAELAASGQLTVGQMVACMIAMTNLIFRMDAIGRLLRLLADARASSARLWELLDAEPQVVTGTERLPSGSLGVTFSGVGVLGGPCGEAILDGCAFTMQPGEVVALVGATGSGKSTLVSLIPRLRDCDRGRVELGNEGGWHAVADLALDDLRRRVQVVFQDNLLFSASIAENLRLADSDADEATLWRALEVAAAADFVRDLDDGLATMVGERGVTLSGGQKQRLCLARALVARPSLLILDDATSALDAVTERQVLDGLRAATGGATVLLVASRLSSVLLADRVLLLDEGHIVAHGSHRELLAGCAAYRELLCLDDDAGAAHV